MSNPYELVPEPPRPKLPGKVRVMSTADDAIDAVAADMLVHAKNCVRAMGDFHVALSGAPALEAVYRRLMYDPACRDLPWKQTHLWMAEEDIAAGGSTPRFQVVADWLLEHSDIPPEQVHPIRPHEPAFADTYRRALSAALAFRGKGQERLDFVLLAVENSGLAHAHVANSDAAATMLAQTSTPLDDRRVVLAPAMLAASRFVGIVAFGQASGASLSPVHVRQVAQFAPLAGELHWYLDADAAHACAASLGLDEGNSGRSA